MERRPDMRLASENMKTRLWAAIEMRQVLIGCLRTADGCAALKLIERNG
jgi:hypothetical protein